MMPFVPHTTVREYAHLVWVLAKTDFRLRYQGSVLGYVWALLKPLAMFLVLNYVFSSLFVADRSGAQVYSLSLFTAILLWNFFSEGSAAALQALITKSQLVTKISLPRFTLILATTVNAAMVFLSNLIVLAAFFVYKSRVPSLEAVGFFFLAFVLIYLLVLAWGLLMAPLQVRYRDLGMIWEVLLPILFYATPVLYSLQMMPVHVQQVLLLNPVAFLIHFAKEGLVNNHFPEWWQMGVLIGSIAVCLAFSVWAYRRLIRRVAEYI